MKEITTLIINNICPIIDTLSTIIVAVVGVIGVTHSLPKISKQMSTISQEVNKKRFNSCENCSFRYACVSPFLEDMGEFDKLNGIENQALKNGLIQLYDEIKAYEFDQDAKIFGSEEHKECLLRKLTMSINLVGGVNGIFNRVKDHIETQRRV
jgi:hypothetical protein